MKTPNAEEISAMIARLKEINEWSVANEEKWATAYLACPISDLEKLESYFRCSGMTLPTQENGGAE